jgi:hypothetical protein
VFPNGLANPHRGPGLLSQVRSLRPAGNKMTSMARSKLSDAIGLPAQRPASAPPQRSSRALHLVVRNGASPTGVPAPCEGESAQGVAQVMICAPRRPPASTHCRSDSAGVALSAAPAAYAAADPGMQSCVSRAVQADETLLSDAAQSPTQPQTPSSRVSCSTVQRLSRIPEASLPDQQAEHLLAALGSQAMDFAQLVQGCAQHMDAGGASAFQQAMLRAALEAQQAAATQLGAGGTAHELIVAKLPTFHAIEKIKAAYVLPEFVSAHAQTDLSGGEALVDTCAGRDRIEAAGEPTLVESQVSIRDQQCAAVAKTRAVSAADLGEEEREFAASGAQLLASGGASRVRAEAARFDALLQVVRAAPVALLGDSPVDTNGHACGHKAADVCCISFDEAANAAQNSVGVASADASQQGASPVGMSPVGIPAADGNGLCAVDSDRGLQHAVVAQIRGGGVRELLRQLSAAAAALHSDTLKSAEAERRRIAMCAFPGRNRL